MNAELCKKALEKVGNPNVLVNLISRRVRQLNSGAGGICRPLIRDVANLGAADIAVTARLATASGNDVARLDPSLVLDDDTGDGGQRMTFRTEFGLGTLAPGRYVLTIEGRRTGRRARVVSRQLSFNVE